jgi:hypothetical protein
MADKPQQELTLKQELFLEALVGDAKGDIRTAMTMAGYSTNTKISEVVNPLKDLIVDRTTTLLAMNAAKATHGVLDILQKPSTPGARNVLQAAKEVLDRSGIVKKEQVEVSTPAGGMFVLPPKKSIDEPTND